jgi:tRNA U38,U39,U40 pseudouridine synthase TruA
MPAGCLGHAASRQHLIGEHDFSSFRAAACQALSPVKKLMRIDISRRGAYLAVRVRGQCLSCTT